MIAADFTRHDCRLGGRRVTYQTLRREYRCNGCTGRIVMKWDEKIGYYVTCGRCGSFDFVHEGRIEREKWHRVEVADSLPPHIARACLAGRDDTMPIKDRDKRARLTRAGIIRLGYRVFKCRGDGCNEILRWRPGRITCPQCNFANQDVDQRYTFPQAAGHFVLRDAPEIQEHYGPNGEPVREIDVLMLFPDVRRNFDASYQIWAGGVVVCEGDGERVLRARPMEVQRRDGRTSVCQGTGQDLVRDGKALRRFSWGERVFEMGDDVPCPGAEGIGNDGGYPQCAACRMSALLKVAIADPELFRFAYYQLATGSWRNYDTILSALERVRGDHQDPSTGETIVGTRPVNTVRFKLRLLEESSTYFDDRTGRLKTTRKHFLQMEPYREDMLRIISAEREALMGVAAPRMLPPGEVEEENDLFLLGPDEMAYADIDAEVEVEGPAPPPFAEVDVQTESREGQDDCQVPDSPSMGELPAWAVKLRRQANSGNGAGDPESPGAITGMIKGLARKVDNDEARIRRFLITLWGCRPEELTRKMYQLTVGLNGKLEQYLEELEACEADSSAASEGDDIPF